MARARGFIGALASVTTHSPAVHVVLHARPQAPQLALSVSKSAQPPGHVVWEHVQAPPAHSGIGWAQGTPAPHCPAAVHVWTALPKHRVSPDAHAPPSDASNGASARPVSWLLSGGASTRPCASSAASETVASPDSDASESGCAIASNAFTEALSACSAVGVTSPPQAVQRASTHAPPGSSRAIRSRLY